MKTIPIIIGLTFLGMVIAVIIAFYYREEYRYNSIVQTIRESAKVSATNQLDKSARIDIRENHVVKEDFERKFKELFIKTVSTKMIVDNISFNYLEGDGEFLKAVYISVTDERGKTYQVLVGTDIEN